MADRQLSKPVRIFAPAKINLSLEVCGRRPDNYHDVVTLMETISLFDVIDIRPSEALTMDSDIGVPVQHDLAWQALERIREYVGSDLKLHVTVRKRIPVSAGLGGGSSDAGTLIGAIGRLLGMSVHTMHDIAASLGSDVPFFLRSGVALASGTGTEVEALESSSRRWYLIVAPDLKIANKTATLYRSLEESEFTDGSRTRTLARQITQQGEFDPSLASNAFQRPLLAYPAFEHAVSSLAAAGGNTVLASGAGPSVFALCQSYQQAGKLRSSLKPSIGRTFIATSVGPDLNRLRGAHLIW